MRWFDAEQHKPLAGQEIIFIDAVGMYKGELYGNELKGVVFKHHFAHCASSFYLSPFDNAVSITVDYSDNYGTTYSICYFNKQFFADPINI